MATINLVEVAADFQRAGFLAEVDSNSGAAWCIAQGNRQRYSVQARKFAKSGKEYFVVTDGFGVTEAGKHATARQVTRQAIEFLRFRIAFDAARGIHIAA
ncbi:MAG: hypothetical protein ACRYGG_10670 [Janthinobacterium lividum]